MDQNILYCKRIRTLCDKFVPTPLEYPNIHILNRSLAHHISLSPDASDEIQKLQAEIKEYNNYIESLNNINGFWNIFSNHEYCLHRNQIREFFNKDIEEKVFSLRRYSFYTDLKIADDVLFYNGYEPKYCLSLPSGIRIEFTAARNISDFPKTLPSNDHLIWSITDDDMEVSLWEILYKECDIDNINIDEESFNTRLLRCMHTLENSGYAKKYTIQEECISPWLKKYSGLSLYVLNREFSKNKLVLEKIMLILSCSIEQLVNCKYFLTDEYGAQYLSTIPGEIGGHKKLKIYGKMDCPSAKRYIADNKYVQHRIFFANENVAKTAGYRPCAKCMKKEYDEWKRNTKIIDGDKT